MVAGRRVPRNIGGASKFRQRLELSINKHYLELAKMRGGISRHFESMVVGLNFFLQVGPCSSLTHTALKSLFVSYEIKILIYFVFVGLPILITCLALYDISTRMSAEDGSISVRDYAHRPIPMFRHKLCGMLRLVHYYLVHPVFMAYLVLQLTIPETMAEIGLPQSRWLVYLMIPVALISLLHGVIFIQFIDTFLPRANFFSNSKNWNAATVCSTLSVAFLVNTVCSTSNRLTGGSLALVVALRALLPAVTILFNTNVAVFYNPKALIVQNILYMSTIMSIVYSVWSYRLETTDGINGISRSVILLTVLSVAAITGRFFVNYDPRYAALDIAQGKISLRSLIIMGTNLIEDSQESRAAFHGNMEQYLKHKQKHGFEEYIKDHSKSTTNPQMQRIQFLSYLFYKLIIVEKDNRNEVTMYFLYFITLLDFNVYHLSMLLSRLRAQSLNIFQKVELLTVEDQIQTRIDETHYDRLALTNDKNNYYSTENADAANPFHDNQDNSNIYNFLNLVILYERLTKNMFAAIEQTHQLYQNISMPKFNYNKLHTQVKLINKFKDKSTKLFNTLDEMTKHTQTLYMMTFAMFVDQIFGDRLWARRVVKECNQRMRKKLRQQQLATRHKNLISDREATEDWVTFLVQVESTNLGNIAYVTKNCAEVFALDSSELLNSNINNLIAPCFQRAHKSMMERFTKYMNVPYLGIPKVRYITTKQGLYYRCTMLTKLSTDLSKGFAMVSAMKRNCHYQTFLLVDREGRLLGGSSEAGIALRDLDSKIGKPLSIISSTLDKTRSDLMFSELSDAYLKSPSISLKTFLRGFGYTRDDLTSIKKASQLVLSEGKKVQLSNRLLRMEGDSHVSTCIKFTFSNDVHADNQDYYYQSVLNFEYSNDNPVQLEEEFDDFVQSQTHQEQASDGLVKAKKSIKSKGFLVSVGERFLAPSRAITQKSGRAVRAQSSIGERQSRSTAIGLLKSGDTLGSMDNQEMLKESRFGSSTASSVEGSSKFASRHVSKSFSHFGWMLMGFMIMMHVGFVVLSEIISSEMNRCLNTEVKRLIDLRYMIFYTISLDQLKRSGVIGIFENLMVRDGLLSGNRMNAVSPNIVYDPMVQARINNKKADDLHMRFMRFVDHFQASDQKKTWMFSAYLNSSSSELPNSKKSTLELPMFKGNTFMRMSTETILDSIDRPVVNASAMYNRTWLTELEFVNSEAFINTYIVKTVLYLLVTDEENYLKMVAGLLKLLSVSYIVSSCLCLGILLVSILIMLKLSRVYRCFEAFYEYEIATIKSQLAKLKANLEDAILHHGSSSDTKSLLTQSLDNKRSGVSHHVDLKFQLISSKRRATARPNGWYRWDTLLAGSICFLLMVGGVGLAEYLITNKTTKINLYELQVMVVNRAYGRLLFVPSNMLMRAYSTALTRKGLRKTTTDLQADVKNLETLFANYELNFKTVSRFVFQTSQPGAESFGFVDFLDSGCHIANYARFNLTKAECDALADNSMGKDIVTTFDWIKLGLQKLMIQTKATVAANLTAKDDKILDLLSTHDFVQLDFLVRYLMVDVFNWQTERFYGKLYAFHNIIVDELQIVRGWLIFLLSLSAVLVYGLGIAHINHQLNHASRSLELIPSEYFKDNPLVKVAFSKIGHRG